MAGSILNPCVSPHGLYSEHIHTPCITQDKDWYAHQVITATNHGMGKWFNFIFSGGLNYQIEHHLFPDLSMLHYRKAEPMVKEVCKKYNINYIQENVFIRLQKTIDIMTGKTSMKLYKNNYTDQHLK